MPLRTGPCLLFAAATVLALSAAGTVLGSYASCARPTRGGLVFGIQPGTANVAITASATCRHAEGSGGVRRMASDVMAVPIVANELTRVHGACF